ncbi:hypothetical protein CEP53_012451 [Fusarium sp. AF-6]|nr:hypothetical protein CEP53_012451 [Fusarium sp. AF-6]
MDEDADYYRIQEIDDSADEATITQAVKANYRRLAREHHPDKNPGDKNATARFQKIQHVFEILSSDEKRKKYNEGTARRRREAAARESREAGQRRNRQQQHERQHRQQEEEEARRQREEQLQKDEQHRQDEKRRQDEQQRAWEQRQAQEEAERQPEPDAGQPEHPKPSVPTPISRLFESIQSNWTRLLWWWLLGFIIIWIAWSLRTPKGTPKASPPPTPLHEMVKELRISQSLGKVQTSFTDKHNLPYELQLMEPLVGALIDPLGDRSCVAEYWDCSADAVDGIVEAYLVPNRLIAKANKAIVEAIFQLNEMIPREPTFYDQLIGAQTTKSSQTMDREARQVLALMADSIYESLDKALTTLRTTEHSLSMLLRALEKIVVSMYGKTFKINFLERN